VIDIMGLGAGVYDRCEESRAGLERDFIAYMEKFSDEAGVAMPREYLVTIGRRR
jgi:hypothetical protein